MITLRAELFENLATTEGLRGALQTAIKLEHATIPTYLYALYSIKPGRNAEIAQLIRSVVIEEMSHMALASNILNAIGGSPQIDAATLLPQYPGSLPGSVESGLVVPLEPLSLDLVANVFMVIEEPEKPLEFEAAAAMPRLTIGEFYAEIMRQIEQFGDTAFTGDPTRQVTHGFSSSDLIEVTSVETAHAAIELIVEQGEGTTTSPLDTEGELAHYYRFAEIHHGRKLVPVLNPPPDAEPDERFTYTGEPIPFDAEGVAPVITNPKADRYPAGSPARQACDTFNYTYTSLLRTLHRTFNGRPDDLPPAIGLMEALRLQAIDMMMEATLGDGTTAGPSFEYQPVLPA